MKLIRLRINDSIKPGILLPDGRRLDSSPYVEDYDEAFFAGDGLNRLRTNLTEQDMDTATLPADAPLAPPLARPSKVVCIGLNYARHAEETGKEIPEEPIIFMKATSAIVGPDDGLLLPKGSKKTDWEVELGVVIGKSASYVEEKDAMDHVAGYVLHNDYSEREYQIERGGQWVKGKSADTFSPMGPVLATRDEVPDPHKLKLWLRVNGEMMQNSSTADMIFGVPHLVSYLSRFMTLLPGDVISTGTPEGVGAGRGRYLRDGDVVELGIEGLGEARQAVKAHPDG